jgi:hypothetical protein
MSDKGENPEQIPGEENLGETQKVISEQGGISGERKEVNVERYGIAALGQILKDIDFQQIKIK